MSGNPVAGIDLGTTNNDIQSLAIGFGPADEEFPRAIAGSGRPAIFITTRRR